MKTKKQRLRKRLPKVPAISWDRNWETRAGHPELIVVGVDEVGRGCLAGPVVAGAVVLPPELNFESHPWIQEITDSKLLKEESRERLADSIRGWARAYAIGVASVEEIDQLNIHHASHLAMARAIEGLGLEPAYVLVDGKFFPKNISCRGQAIIKGDLRCLSIACGSILAKVWRDRHLISLSHLYPGYGLAEHKGYSTPAHSEALTRLGACEIHRKTFAPVAAVLQGSKFKAAFDHHQAVEGAKELSLF